MAAPAPPNPADPNAAPNPGEAQVTVPCGNPAACANPSEAEATTVAPEPPGWKDAGHAALDGAGMIPVVQEFANGANAIWYATEGDWTNAAISAAGMIPVAGDAAVGARLVAKGAKLLKGADEAENTVRGGTEVAADVARLAKGPDEAAPASGGPVPAGRDPTPPADGAAPAAAGEPAAPPGVTPAQAASGSGKPPVDDATASVSSAGAEGRPPVGSPSEPAANVAPQASATGPASAGEHELVPAGAPARGTEPAPAGAGGGTPPPVPAEPLQAGADAAPKLAEPAQNAADRIEPPTNDGAAKTHTPAETGARPPAAGELSDPLAKGPADAAEALSESGFVSPSSVRFSQDSIKGTFRDGGSVKDLAARLRDGSVHPSEVPPVRLVQRDGQMYTLDNRRLAAFQDAGVNVPYRMATLQEIANEGFKFSTKNDGLSVRVRGGGG